MSKRFISKTLIVSVCLGLWGAQAIAAEDPVAVVKTGTEQIVKILKQNPQDIAARRKQIEAVVDGYFDFDAIARDAVGRQWSSLPPEKQQEFTQEFRKLLFNTYIGDIEKYARENISYKTESIYPGYVVVEEHINGQGGPDSINYSLHRKNGDWKVYDVSANGMSLVITYRSQFDTILANGSFDNLLTTIRQKVAQICRINHTC